MLIGFDDMAGEASRLTNRICGLLTRPPLERVIGPLKAVERVRGVPPTLVPRS